MNPLLSSHADDVGPVLTSGRTADAVLEAIEASNDDVTTIAHGAYTRVRVPVRCVVSRAAIEAALGRSFRLPGDLEAIMPSFVGELTISESGVEWRR